MSLCPECEAAAEAWRAYRTPPVRSSTASPAGAVRAHQDALRANYDDWRDRVTFQLDLISTICERTHQ